MEDIDRQSPSLISTDCLDMGQHTSCPKSQQFGWNYKGAMMFYALNDALGIVGRLPKLTGKLRNRKSVQIGPSWNNKAPPHIYASDDLQDFISHVNNTRSWAIKLVRQLEEQDLTGWFWVDDNGNLVKHA